MENAHDGGLASPAPLVLPLILGEWLSASRHARVICDEQQRVLWCNASLQQLLDKDIGFKVERDQIIFTDRKTQAAMANFIQSPQVEQTAIRLSTGEGGGNYIMQCRRLRVGPYGEAFGLRILCAYSSRERDFKGFEDYFYLTNREVLICRELLKGKTVHDIVNNFDKSSDTIRFHIKNVYQKVGVSSREALFAKLHMFMFD